MLKIAEIPVYGITKSKHFQKTTNLDNRYGELTDDAKAMINEIEPFRSYEYNHIVGVISIELSSHDVWFRIFKMKRKSRYIWASKRKTFLYDIQSNDTHLHISKLDNVEIRTRIKEYVGFISKTHFKTYFVDTEAFFNILDGIDFEFLFSNLRRS